MQILSNTPQGSESWHAARAGRFCASEAAAAMGVSKYTTRDALLRQKATGITEEVGAAKQRIFDAGHAAESAASPIADALAGVEFFPAVGVADIEGLPLLASFDGIDILEEVLWETKLLNQSLVAQVQAEDLEPHYWSQLEHQMLVSNAGRVLFTTSDGTPEGTHHMWYESKPERRQQVLAAWHQFAKDLAAYVPTAVHAAPAVGRAPEHLPALLVEIRGEVTASNLDEFKNIALAAIRSVNRDLKTDQDFADSAKARKWCEDIEARVKATKEHAMAQTASIDMLFKALDEISDEAREVRIALGKDEKRRSETLRGEIVASGVAAYRAHIDSLNQSLGLNYMPSLPVDFGGAVKGKRTIDSLHGAVNDELARAKIAAAEVYTRIQCNLKALHTTAGDCLSLFADLPAIVTKAQEDFDALVHTRVAQHQAAEQKRLDAERERIRAEELAKLHREEEARAHAQALELARQQRDEAALAQRQADEASAAECAAHAITQAAAPAPDAAPAAPEGLRGSYQRVWAAPEAGAAGVVSTPSPGEEQQDDGARINLGAINEHLAPIRLDAAGLESLGFVPVATLKASKLYRAGDLHAIRAALIAHLAELETA